MNYSINQHKFLKKINQNGFAMGAGNKNGENENLELIEQIKYFKTQIEKLENENNQTKSKIKEYDKEYRKLKEELKQLEANNINNEKNENNEKFTTNEKIENLKNSININNNK